jgi:hypothetical protein
MTRRVANGERVVVERSGRAVLAMVPPEDLALLAALDALAARRGLHPADAGEDWSGVFGELQAIDGGGVEGD